MLAAIVTIFDAMASDTVRRAEGTRRRGLGREAVRLLEEAHPGRQLAAFSQRADEFWGALGWQRHIQLNRNPQLYRPLFVSPAGVR